MCTIHFDSNCYTKEFKMTGNYGGIVLVLKPDAIPTLHLTPPPPKPIIDDPILITSLDIKNMGNCEVEMEGEDQKPTVEAEPPPLQRECPNMTRQELNEINNENKYLQKQVDYYETKLANINRDLETHADLLRNHEEAVRVVEGKHDKLKQSMLSIQDQKSLLAKVFSERQIKLIAGKQKSWWTNDDMAMGYTIRNLSNPRFYKYLSKNLGIPLPGLSSITRWEFIKKNPTNKMDGRKNSDAVSGENANDIVMDKDDENGKQNMESE